MDDYTDSGAPSGGAPQGGALSMVSERSGGNPLNDIAGMLGKMLSPEKRAKDESLAFAAGIGSNNPSGHFENAMRGGYGAQSALRTKQDELQAQYIPLIMQSLVQGQGMQITANKNQQDYLKDIVPRMKSEMGSLLINKPNATRADVLETLTNVAGQYQVPPSVVGNMAYSIPKNSADVPAWLQSQLGAAAGAEKQLPTAATNALGQATGVNPVQGTASTLAPGGAGRAPAAGAQPTNVDVKAMEGSQGDVKGFTEGLQSKVSAYGDMLQRMNAINKSLQEFTPGRYVGMAGGVAAAVKDLSKYVPFANPETVQGYVNSLLGADGSGKGDALAAKQFANSLVAQEGIGQTKALMQGDSGSGGGRMAQQTIGLVTNSLLGPNADPGAFDRLADFMRAQGANAANKLSGWSDYLHKTPPGEVATHKFDAAWESEQMKKLVAGGYGTVATPPGMPNAVPGPEAANPSANPPPVMRTGPGPAITGAPPAAAPAQPAQQAAALPVNIASFEPGAVLVKGVPVVVDPKAPQGYRLARPRAPRTDTPTNGGRGAMGLIGQE